MGIERSDSEILKMLLSALHHHGATKSDMLMVAFLVKASRSRFEFTRWIVQENPSMDEILIQAMERKD